MTQVHDFSLSLICLSQAVAAEAATETTTAKAVAKVTTTEASRPALETAARLLLAIRP